MAWFVNPYPPQPFLKLTEAFFRSMLLFISAILSFVWRTGSVLDPTDWPPLSARAVLGPRIAVTGVLVLGMVYLGMIVRTLKNYGSYRNSSRAALLRVGVGLRDEVELGKVANVPEVNRAKQLRARDIDAAMERRGRERQRTASSHVRRREEESERRGRGSMDSEDGGLKVPKLGLKGLLGLGLGSRAAATHQGQELELGMGLKTQGGVVSHNNVT